MKPWEPIEELAKGDFSYAPIGGDSYRPSDRGCGTQTSRVQRFFQARASRSIFNSEKLPAEGELEPCEEDLAGASVTGTSPSTLKVARRASRSAGAIRIFPRRPFPPTRRCGSDPSEHQRYTRLSETQLRSAAAFGDNHFGSVSGEMAPIVSLRSASGAGAPVLTPRAFRTCRVNANA